MKHRVIFVGVHNKPGKQPLDGSTISGKRIDKRIKGIDSRADCVKSNLWEIERMPLVDEQMEYEILWGIKYDPKPNDIVVLLGGIVQRSFPKIFSKNILCFPHPSLHFSKISPEEYINKAISEINKKIKLTNP